MLHRVELAQVKPDNFSPSMAIIKFLRYCLSILKFSGGLQDAIRIELRILGSQCRR
jgi:hypothetical protein